MDKQLGTLRGLQFWLYAASGVATPFLPLYFAEKGYSSSQIGAMLMAGPLIAIFFQPIWGYVSDRMQTVKKVVFLLWILTILFSIGLFVSEAYAMTFMFIILMYVFFQPSFPLLDSITIQAVERRGATYGSIRLFGSLGFTAIAVAGGYILEAMGGIQQLGYLFWGVWIIPILLLFRLKDEPAEGERMTLRSIQGIFGNKSFLLFLLLVFVITIPHRMNDAMFGLYMKENGASDTQVGWGFALSAIVELPAFLLLSRYLKRIHEFVLIGIVGILYSIRWLFYAWASEPWQILLLQAGASVTFAIFWISAVHYTVRVLPRQLGATGQSLLAMVFLGLAGMTGATVGGWLNDNYGGSSMYYFAAVVSLIGGLGFLAAEYAARMKKPARA
ncbi:MFS transporter [Paenibacillus sepulcri]